MELKIEVSDSDVADITATIAAKLDEITQKAGLALYEAGELIATACKEEAPVISGALMGSINVTQESETEVTVAPGVEYAYWVEFGEWEPGGGQNTSYTGNPYMQRGVEKSRADVEAYIKSAIGSP